MTEQSNPERAEVLSQEEIASIARACEHGRAVQLASQTVRRLLAQLAAQSKLIAERAREVASVVRAMTDTLAFAQSVGAHGVAGADICAWRDRLAALLADSKEEV